ncbi:MAG: S1 RNA-binding domain-containing protein [Lachnospiraceae bacterium]|nr:S1 RNA-binding domain-containing protein [Lachnospiraceae bacterium]
MTQFFPEGTLINRPENYYYTKNLSTLTDAMHEGRILEAVVKICDSKHNLIVDLNGIKGIIPREDGALGIKEHTVRDIAIISRVNRPVAFIVVGIERDLYGNPTVILSRRAAQERCSSGYIEHLNTGDIIPAKITHMEQFGAFADIGCGVASLLPIDSMSVSRIEHPKQRFTTGMDIKAVVKSKENGRICISHKELLGTWQENAELFSIGETVSGIIRSIEDYGAFVELTPNLAGLAELKEGLEVGMQVSVYIKNIIPSKMKIKLIIIDTFDTRETPKPPKYFCTDRHINKFRYSPPDCEKVVESSFS